MSVPSLPQHNRIYYCPQGDCHEFESTWAWYNYIIIVLVAPFYCVAELCCSTCGPRDPGQDSMNWPGCNPLGAKKCKKCGEPYRDFEMV
ncbi:hypothetical protein K493DRAFT_318826 [Basidiobolus meristosporus CBS 931.73]|uniref:Uncharacterized protein n=1 Tax=Basidiobolus meristosporus CBS 931.73 TaxID=1314790 RepID=A0A1Y1XU48_9FUNG|nr:hypothetical protein K493DRAFT_318826 [Basidiobolus meristosporus CBS 931.73]|eukprot:ORX89282.1 hypothetical protein K493DRAFT_318826 [Basidiobolus meristosporus CBS 931.73]